MRRNRIKLVLFWCMFVSLKLCFYQHSLGHLLESCIPQYVGAETDHPHRWDDLGNNTVQENVSFVL